MHYSSDLPGPDGPRRRRRLRPFTATAVALTIGATSAVALPAVAAPVPAERSARAAEQDPVDDESRAARTAAETGSPVEVLSRRDETTQVFANPDGTSTWKQYVRPAFAKVDGAWKEADATLRKRADGRVGPAAATFGLSFSGGGGSPLATMEKDGASLSIEWPAALPEPRLEGNTAVYPEVLPQVDLRVQADVDGFAQHLVVKSREAAANPQLARISYGLKSKGAELKADGKGNLKVTDGAGKELFTAPTPVMWDSSGGRKTAGGTGARLTRSAVALQEEAPPSKVVEMPTEVVDDTLRIAPDVRFLNDPGTVFPVVIDPIFSGGGRNNWTIAYKNGGSLDGTSFWNGGGFKDKLARVGHEDWTNGTARSYFQMNTKGLGGARIVSSTFNILNSYSWSCTASPVDFGWTGSISSSTTWNNQPKWNKTLQTKTFAHGWTGDGSECKGGQGEDFSNAALKDLVQKIADGNESEVTLGLRAAPDHEDEVSSWKKIHNNPHLEVTYNRPPKVDSAHWYQGPWSSGGSGSREMSCSSDPAAWPTVGRTDLTLAAKVSDPDGGQVTAAFAVWEYGGEGVSAPKATVSSGGTAQVTLPVSGLEDGKRYKWHVRARDGIEDSPDTPQCGFNVDKSAPAKPTVTATDGFPLDKPVVAARKDRKLRLTSSDRFGLDGFCYSLNKQLPASNELCAGGTFVKADKDGTAAVSVTPSLWPNNRLHVQAVDRAGNLSPYDGGDSPRSDTTLIVTDQPDFVHNAEGRVDGDLPGDLDGDGYVDLLATDKQGNLRFYGGNGDGSVKKARVVDAGGWNGARIAHRGDFISATEGVSKDGYEDYFVKIGNKVYLYPGDGNGAPLTRRRKELIRPAGKNDGPLVALGRKCVDLAGGKNDNGTGIRIWDCNGTAAQDFQLTDRRLRALGKCVDVPGGKGVDGTAVQLYDCNGTAAQEWLDRGDGSLYNAASDRCLDLPGAKTANGTALTVHHCNGTDAQRFEVPGSWSDVHQILTPGNVDGKPGNDLIANEGRRLVVYSGTAEGPLAAEAGTYRLRPGVPVGDSRGNEIQWAASGDIDGDGVPDLMGRLTSAADHSDDIYGKLFLYRGSRTPGNRGGVSYEAKNMTLIGGAGWTLDNIPDLAFNGNVQGKVIDSGMGYRQFVPVKGQETPDFWATHAGGASGTGVLRFYPLQPSRHEDPVVVGDGSWTTGIIGIF
ncbi:ricin-type beta-trefoil lectin domain protein [Streptomyces sp. URMC 124]|uniref:ricin-type beta-trefoil lectin domain protein n=1 Tax=Streptomyces sp. URMC 124 TaxID=3423405 RepID=UPI003F1DB072